jgi:hypothetical protein
MRHNSISLHAILETMLYARRPLSRLSVDGFGYSLLREKKELLRAHAERAGERARIVVDRATG